MTWTVNWAETARSCSEHAGRRATSLLPIGENHNDPGLLAIVEHFGSSLHSYREWSFAGWRQRLQVTHDKAGSVGGRLKIEPDIALLCRSWAIRDKPDATEARCPRENLGKCGAHFINPRSQRGNALVEISRHGARSIEHDHGVIGAWRRRFGAKGSETGKKEYEGRK
jgi:hypothetical protein